MKAIMIVNLPDKINVDEMCKTPVSLTFEHKSYKTILYADGYLKTIPQKKEVDVKKIEDIMHTEFQMVDVIQDKIIAKIKLDTDKLIALGYNYCIDEILGEEQWKR